MKKNTKSVFDDLIDATPPAAESANPGQECAREWSEKKRQAKIDANWQTIADVDWEDLEYFCDLARHTKDPANFDTCVRILEALRKQILTK